MHWNGDWHMGLMWIWWLLIVAAIVAVVWVAMTSARRGRGGDSRESPEQALKRRYANGEIDRETYQRMLEDLRR